MHPDLTVLETVMLLLHHPGIGRQGGIRTHRRLFLRQTGLPVSFTCRLWWIRMELHHRCILRSRFTVCRLRFWPTDPFWRLSEVSIPIPFKVPTVFKTGLRAVADKQAFGGSGEIRTHGQGVAVPCLSSWLRNHFSGGDTVS